MENNNVNGDGNTNLDTNTNSYGAGSGAILNEGINTNVSGVGTNNVVADNSVSNVSTSNVVVNSSVSSGNANNVLAGNGEVETLTPQTPVNNSGIVENLADNSNGSLPSNNSSLETNPSNTNNPDDNYQYIPPSNGRYVLLVILFVGLIALVYFLPNLTEFIAVYKAGKNQVVEEIVDGRLICSYKKTGTRLDVNYNNVFTFTDNKLDKLEFTLTTKGDQNLDVNELEQAYNSCLLLKDSALNVSGVSVQCNLNLATVEEKQIINYNLIDLDQVTSAYGEAGGMFPEFESREDISKIERNMNANGYTCKIAK